MLRHDLGTDVPPQPYTPYTPYMMPGMVPVGAGIAPVSKGDVAPNVPEDEEYTSNEDVHMGDTQMFSRTLGATDTTTTETYGPAPATTQQAVMQSELDTAKGSYQNLIVWGAVAVVALGAWYYYNNQGV